MASVTNPAANQVKLNNGQTVAAQQGGWYDGQQYWGGTLSNPGQENILSSSPSAGKQVSNEVIAQTNPNNVGYIQKQQQTPQAAPTTPTTPSTTPGSSSLGGGSVSLPTVPTFDLVAATNAAYNTPEIQAAQKAITDRQTALASASAEINDNPFYSEATRVGKQAKLTAEANNDIQVQQDQLASLKADAAIKVNAAQGQYNINQQAYQENLTNFNNLVSQGALDNANPSDLASLSVSTGIPISMMQSIISASQKKDNPVQVITSTDNAGNLTLLAVDSQGNVKNTTTIAGAGKATGGANSTPGSAAYLSNAIATMTPAVVKTLNSYGNISPQDWQQALATWLAQGLSKDDFVKNFGQYADTNRGDFLAAYGFANPKPAATIKQNQAVNSAPTPQAVAKPFSIFGIPL